MQKYDFSTIFRYGWRFVTWVTIACVLGIGLGAVGAVFHHAIDHATHLRGQFPWLILSLPVIGVAIVLLYRLCGAKDDRGTNQIFSGVRSGQPIRLRTAPLIFISTVLTHLAGGSAGREGAALQLGGSLAAGAGRLLRLEQRDNRVLVMCGMSAAFSALFGTPLTAAIFAMEVVSVGSMPYVAIVPNLCSAMAALQVARLMGVAPAGYAVTGVPDLTPLSMVGVLAVGVVCALVSVLFCRAVHLAPKVYNRLFKSPLVAPLVGGLILIGLTLLLGTQDYNGAGTHVIEQAVAGQARPEAFLLKILFTAITLGAGFRGGEIVPVLFTGSTLGCTVAPLVGLSPSFGAALGMTALFCGTTNCPIASMLLSYELFGDQGLVLYGLCCAVSYTLSGYYGLYSEQKFVFSKFFPDPIDLNAK